MTLDENFAKIVFSNKIIEISDSCDMTSDVFPGVSYLFTKYNVPIFNYSIIHK